MKSLSSFVLDEKPFFELPCHSIFHSLMVLCMCVCLQVLVTLEQLERVSTFQEFVQIFSQFGNEMVEFAHLTGDRQNVRALYAHTHTPLLIPDLLTYEGCC